MFYGTGRLWKAAAALLLALVMSLGTLGVAQAIQPGGSASQVRWYEVGGSAADRMLSKDGGVIATWTHVKYYKKNYTWRAYWTVKNTSSSPKKVGCAGYQNYGLKGYQAKIYYQDQGKWKFSFEGEVKDAKCRHLGGAYREMLQPGQLITSWAHFQYAGRNGTCTKLTLPTGRNVPEHVGYTECVNPYARSASGPPSGSGPPSESGPPSGSSIRSPFDSSQTWYVCRGYNTRSHTVAPNGTDLRYALDLVVKTPPYVTVNGCDDPGNLDASAGLPVYAPVPGHTSACWPSNTQFVCIRSSAPRTNGYYFIIGHVDPDSRLLNTDITKEEVAAGKVIGRLERVGKQGLQIAHIHIQVNPEGPAKESVPFISANGTAICQQDFPSNRTPNKNEHGGEEVHGCS